MAAAARQQIRRPTLRSRVFVPVSRRARGGDRRPAHAPQHRPPLRAHASSIRNTVHVAMQGRDFNFAAALRPAHADIVSGRRTQRVAGGRRHARLGEKTSLSSLFFFFSSPVQGAKRQRLPLTAISNTKLTAAHAATLLLLLASRRRK